MESSTSGRRHHEPASGRPAATPASSVARVASDPSSFRAVRRDSHRATACPSRVGGLRLLFLRAPRWRRSVGRGSEFDPTLRTTSWSRTVHSSTTTSSAMSAATPIQPPHSPELLAFAKRVVWFNPPESTLANDVFFLNHLMVYATSAINSMRSGRWPRGESAPLRTGEDRPASADRR